MDSLLEDAARVTGGRQQLQDPKLGCCQRCRGQVTRLRGVRVRAAYLQGRIDEPVQERLRLCLRRMLNQVARHLGRGRDDRIEEASVAGCLDHVVGVIVGPVLAMFLSSLFAATLARQVELGRTVTGTERARIARSESPFLLLALPPVVFVGILTLLGSSLSASIRWVSSWEQSRSGSGAGSPGTAPA